MRSRRADRPTVARSTRASELCSRQRWRTRHEPQDVKSSRPLARFRAARASPRLHTTRQQATRLADGPGLWFVDDPAHRRWSSVYSARRGTPRPAGGNRKTHRSALRHQHRERMRIVAQALILDEPLSRTIVRRQIPSAAVYALSVLIACAVGALIAIYFK
jgi:hypothetical protein